MTKGSKLSNGDNVKVEVAGSEYDAIVTDADKGLCTFTCVGPKGDESNITVNYNKNKVKEKKEVATDKKSKAKKTTKKKAKSKAKKKR